VRVRVAIRLFRDREAKSTRQAGRSGVTMMFDGLTSRCTDAFFVRRLERASNARDAARGINAAARGPIVACGSRRSSKFSSRAARDLLGERLALE